MKLRTTLARRKNYLIGAAVVAAAVIVLRMTLLTPPRVATAKVERRDLLEQVYGNGTVEAKEVVGVSSKITGKIAALYADQGDTVKGGQILARLESDDFTQQERQSEAGVARGGAAMELERAALRKARANRELAERNARRFRTLADKNLVSQLEAEQYENAFRVAREEEARGVAALAAAEMEVRASRAGLGVTRSRVADTVIRAPRDGVIISRDLEVGATVTPGLAIFTLADPETVWVTAHVDESRLKGVAVGKEAVISLRSAPGEAFPGRVARVGRESDRVTEELEVNVAFGSPLAHFRLGEQAEVLIAAGEGRQVPSIPAAALVARWKARGVYVVEDGRLRFREITVGIEDRRGFVAVRSGLDGSERIALASLPAMAKFRDGMKVRVAP